MLNLLAENSIYYKKSKICFFLLIYTNEVENPSQNIINEKGQSTVYWLINHLCPSVMNLSRIDKISILK